MVFEKGLEFPHLVVKLRVFWAISDNAGLLVAILEPQENLDRGLGARLAMI